MKQSTLSNIRIGTLRGKDYYMMLGRIEAHQLSEIIKRQKWYK